VVSVHLTTPYSVNGDTTTIANGNHLITAKAFDAAGNTAVTAARQVTVNNPPQLITNGGFEGTNSPWAIVGSAAWTNVGGAHGGTGLMRLVNADSTTGTTYQQITIPSTATGSLTFWVSITTSEPGTTAYDFLYVEVRSTTGTLLGTVGTLSNLNMSTGYSLKSYSVAAWRGQTVRLQFRAVNDVSLATTFKIDDVSVR
jgi:hypothetical protein